MNKIPGWAMLVLFGTSVFISSLLVPYIGATAASVVCAGLIAFDIYVLRDILKSR